MARSHSLQRLVQEVAPVRARLAAHPLYRRIGDEAGLRRFMACHVFAVWDFQSLLRALHRAVIPDGLPWTPSRNPDARRLLNEIVLAEESDQVDGLGPVSHFEMYREAMARSGADVGPIDRLVRSLEAGMAWRPALADCGAPPEAVAFSSGTLALVEEGSPHALAAAFAFGREDVIPAMFQSLIDGLADGSPGEWSLFRDYLERHIHLDIEHGAQARKLVQSLCGEDARRWEEATRAAKRSLEERLTLWDRLVEVVAVRGGREAVAS